MTGPWVAESEHDRAVIEALQGVRAFSDAIDRMNGGMKDDMAINATDLAALRMLIMREQRDETVSPHELARHLRISTASTTKLLDRLTASGHLERRAHPRDRRSRVVVLTDESKTSFFRHFGENLRAMRGVADEYTTEELQVIVRFMADMSVAIDPDARHAKPTRVDAG
ncbi:MarR family winged helix-turn-helix transcriptional regulator [Microbacterium rhizomatis]|uniref:MarR family transcriptional regulator n=1 Tax=Microbacterium rhizomatis TaxID=1631477 RepID=A0A5J5J5Z9_9MICO|nr:MarR family transcriptional regulator [Microbacterium rhizomatis]KAA9110278.1 MarR family transcriptional regulator [Microbacterium rhizomatis]